MKVDEIRSTFEQQRYVVLRSILAPAVAASFFAHVKEMAAAGNMTVGKEGTTPGTVPGTPMAYGDPVMEHLLDGIRPTLERLTGLTLSPTFSFYRLYKKGDVLPRHRDRRECEISLSVNFGQEPEEPWPLWVEGPLGSTGAKLRPGDAVLYRGIECDHWREAYAGEQLAQVFLHYVDANGKYQGLKFDRRESLALDGPARRQARQ